MKNIIKMAPPNCYCGQNGDTNQNMLQCAKCKRWFHEGCVKCLDIPMLIGDRFYIFICSRCNAGSECLGRLEMEWDEVTHLLLYNLTILEKKKYFHLDDAMIPFLLDNWERFRLFGNIATSKKNARTKVLQALEKYHNKFKCGKEVKKCKNNWALRVRIPPEAPNVLPSAARLKKDVVVWDFQAEGRMYHILSLKRPTKSRENCKNGKHKAKLSAPSLRHKNVEVSKCRGSVPHSENGINKAKHKVKRTTSSFNEDSARLGLLDSLIPLPSDFKNGNNPFRKLCKKSNFRRGNSQFNKGPLTVSSGNRKRLRKTLTSDPVALNGSHTSDHSSTESSFYSTKEDFLQRTKDGKISILGKRTTSSGKVQYLIEKNRENLKKAEPEREPLFQVTYLCKCPDCKCYDDIEELHPIMWN